MKRHKNIKSIYEGLPDKLVDKVYNVADSYRVNPLSLKKGGVEIIVEYTTGEVLQYDKVKYPSRYVFTILKQVVSQAINDNNIEELVRENLKKVFVKETSKDQKYKEIWNSSKKFKKLIASLMKYDADHKPNKDYIKSVLPLCNEKWEEDRTYIHLITYNKYSFFISLSNFLSLIFDEEEPFDSIQILSIILDRKSQSDEKPFIIDLKDLFEDIDETIGYRRNSERQEIVSDWILFESTKIIAFKENKRKNCVKQIEIQEYIDEYDCYTTYSIKGEPWASGVDPIEITFRIKKP